MTELSLSWETYQKNICNGLGLLQQKGEFVDMTIAADGHHVKVHQMIMSLVSPYIKGLITSTPCAHPVVFLNRVSSNTLQSILEYAYTGEVSVKRENLSEFLEACAALHIKGLQDMTEPNTNTEGGFLSFMGARANPPQPTEVKTMNNDDSKLEQDENEQILEDEPMDDTYFSEGDDAAEVIISESVQTEESPKSIGTSDAIPKTTIQYSLSCQGSIQLVLNRYIYQMRHARRNNETVWRCVNYNKNGCSAIAVTKGDKVLERGRTHNHPFLDKQIIKRVKSGNMYTALTAVQSISALNKTLSRTLHKSNTENYDIKKQSSFKLISGVHKNK